MKIASTQVVFREFPGEITLALNISNCPCRCKGCHSPELAGDIGEELTLRSISAMLEDNHGITCIGFMGGDADPEEVVEAAHIVRTLNKDIMIGWYSGRDKWPDIDTSIFDYIKIGHYDEEKGPLDCPSTNQRMYRNHYDGYWEDITEKFWKKDFLG